jgi:hypothetical protein
MNVILSERIARVEGSLYFVFVFAVASEIERLQPAYKSHREAATALPKAGAKAKPERLISRARTVENINHFSNLQIICSKTSTNLRVKSQRHLTPSKQARFPLRGSFHPSAKIETRDQKGPSRTLGLSH